MRIHGSEPRGSKRVPLSPISEGRFGRMFRRLRPAKEYSDEQLTALAEQMREPESAPGGVPGGWGNVEASCDVLDYLGAVEVVVGTNTIVLQELRPDERRVRAMVDLVCDLQAVRVPVVSAAAVLDPLPERGPLLGVAPVRGQDGQHRQDPVEHHGQREETLGPHRLRVDEARAVVEDRSLEDGVAATERSQQVTSRPILDWLERVVCDRIVAADLTDELVLL